MARVAITIDNAAFARELRALGVAEEGIQDALHARQEARSAAARKLVEALYCRAAREQALVRAGWADLEVLQEMSIADMAAMHRAYIRYAEALADRVLRLFATAHPNHEPQLISGTPQEIACSACGGLWRVAGAPQDGFAELHPGNGTCTGGDGKAFDAMVLTGARRNVAAMRAAAEGVK